ncbi:hypothetical protein [Mucilaginibacter glaciei]|uniref:Uncharacterized protein n=1 Tax=Mucilaginibacter glaciei TaxID=2772109 RepID=A0A926NP98_9SPHI|nr:hypothetical protein [Mucilaginibacter glaciei]MBD1394836.1 hypothetical protein [Mucilaginibacter glaciei]
MKKSERKAMVKAAKKAVTINIQNHIIAAIKQSAAELKADTKKIEKKLVKASGKVAKKFAKMISAAQPVEKEKAPEVAAPAPKVPVAQTASKAKTTKPAKTAEPVVTQAS